MKRLGNAGYSLVEILVAIALLAVITIPTYTCLTMSVKINAASDQLLKAQLAVSSAVETLLAEGYSDQLAQRLPDVTVVKADQSGYYTVTSGEVSVTTYLPEADLESSTEASVPDAEGEEATS